MPAFYRNNTCSQTAAFCLHAILVSSNVAHFAKTLQYVLADRGDFKRVVKNAQCFPTGIMQFLNQHTSKYQKLSKHFVRRGRRGKLANGAR